MNLEPGLIVVIAAVLIFYLRLILLQRARVRQTAPLAHPAVASKRKIKDKSLPPAPPRYSILTQNRRNLLIGGVGLLVMLTGALLKAGVVSALPVEPYWWIMAAIGIVGFGWAFAL